MNLYFVDLTPFLNSVQDYSTIVSGSRLRINRNSIYGRFVRSLCCEQRQRPCLMQISTCFPIDHNGGALSGFETNPASGLCGLAKSCSSSRLSATKCILSV